MLITLIILLFLLRVSLRMMIIGINVSSFVAGRLNDIRKLGDKSIYKNVKRDTHGVKRFAITSAYATKRVADYTLEGVATTAKFAATSSAKLVLKLLEKCVSILIKVLLAMEALIVILDIVIFLIIAVSAYSYLQFLNAM